MRRLSLSLNIVLALAATSAVSATDTRLNIVWINVEDMSVTSLCRLHPDR